MLVHDREHRKDWRLPERSQLILYNMQALGWKGKYGPTLCKDTVLLEVQFRGFMSRRRNMFAEQEDAVAQMNVKGNSALLHRSTSPLSDLLAPASSRFHANYLSLFGTRGGLENGKHISNV